MKAAKIFILIGLALLLCAPAQAKKKPQNIYLFGLSISFTDSLVYITDIQQIDSIALESRTKFLPDRQHYSYALEDFLQNKYNLTQRTCMVFFDDNKSKLDKKRLKVLNRLERKKNSNIVKLSQEQFQFYKP